MTSNSTTTKSLFQEWVTAYSDEMYRWSLYKVSDKHTAEDLVQDTFLAAYHAAENFRANSGPKTWLFSILNRKIIDHYRKSSRKIEDPEDIGNITGIEYSDQLFNENDGWKEQVTTDFWDNEGELLDNNQFLDVLNSCMSKLPAHWATSIKLKYLLEKDSKEICQELGISPSNYWQIIHRAKLLLKSCLELNWFSH
jgi:RNA polymerase sigma-70 factor (ECF subfamily)